MRRVIGKFMYYTEVDISINDGPGINEREFVNSLLQRHPERVICVLPYPRNPNNYYHPSIHYVFNHQKKPVLYGFHLVGALRRILTLLRRERVRAFVTRMGIIPVIPLYVSRFTRTPVALKTLSLYYIFTPGVGTVRRSVRLISKTLRPWFNQVLQSAVVADAQSEVYRDWIESQFDVPGDRLTVVRNVANANHFQPRNKVECRQVLGLERFDYVVGYVGALAPERHLEILIRALGATTDNFNIGCLMVGDGRIRAELEALAKREGVEDRIIFVGSIPYQDLPAYVSAMDVGVDLTSLLMRFEHGSVPASFSQKIAQYLVAGVPVVAWDSPDNRFLHEHDLGRTARYGDAVALERAIIEMLKIVSAQGNYLRERIRDYATKNLSTDAAVDFRMSLWEDRLSSFDS